MAATARDGWTLHYEAQGQPDAPAVVLIAGSGEQIGSVEFPDEQCDRLVGAGLRVIRVDNRDNGLSVPDVDPGAPDWRAIFQATPENPPPLPYTAGEMSDDVIAILDHAGISRAVLVGASMGAAIVRWAAVRHPDRVRGLMVVMGASGAVTGEDGPAMSDEAIGRLLFLMTPQNRAKAVDDLVECWRWLWGPGYPFDEPWIRSRVEASFDRAYRPQGVARNLAAMSVPGLWEAQSTISCPTIVLHGGNDPVSPLEHGQAIARRINGAELLAIPEMGHAMHEEVWPEMTERLVRLSQLP